MIMPQHIKIKKGAMAERVIVAGDADRIKMLSRLLKGAKLLNKTRFLVYTGTYNGKRISLVSHGIGMPSMAIALEEVIAYGGRSIIRLGTAGGLIREIKYGDIILATSASCKKGGTLWEYFPKLKSTVFYPDKSLSSRIEKLLLKSGQKFFKGPIFSSNAFYSEEDILKDRRFIGVEMEAAALFKLAEYRKVRAAALLVASDNVVLRTPLLSSKDLSKQINFAAKIALDALTA
ncbi:MAG: hypothetical protein QW644_00320 [Candidatus Micrarchaeaceae archaeon]